MFSDTLCSENVRNLGLKRKLVLPAIVKRNTPSILRERTQNSNHCIRILVGGSNVVVGVAAGAPQEEIAGIFLLFWAC